MEIVYDRHNFGEANPHSSACRLQTVPISAAVGGVEQGRGPRHSGSTGTNRYYPRGYIMSAGSLAALRALRNSGVQQPRILTIAITGACNLRCGHCWPASGEKDSAGHLPEGAVRRLLSEFIDLEGEGVCFTGGEPLCHPSWLQLLRFARSLGLEKVCVQTNAILWTKETVSAVRQLDFPDLQIQVSLDGVTAATHDPVRGEGAFSEAVAGLRRMIQGGLGRNLTLNFTEMRHNLAEFPQLLRMAQELGIGSVVAGTMVRSGRGACGNALEPPGLEEYRQLRRLYVDDPGFRELYDRIGTMAALEWGRESGPRSDSCTFSEHPYLSAAGRLYPCVLCQADEYAVAGVSGKNLAAAFIEGAQLWGALMKESECRSLELAECRDCPGQLACAGGCMGRALAHTGKCCTVDDRCPVRKAIYSDPRSL